MFLRLEKLFKMSNIACHEYYSAQKYECIFGSAFGTKTSKAFSKQLVQQERLRRLKDKN